MAEASFVPAPPFFDMSPLPELEQGANEDGGWYTQEMSSPRLAHAPQTGTALSQRCFRTRQAVQEAGNRVRLYTRRGADLMSARNTCV